jgi:hypothetical protein
LFTIQPLFGIFSQPTPFLLFLFRIPLNQMISQQKQKEDKANREKIAKLERNEFFVGSRTSALLTKQTPRIIDKEFYCSP